ncbi:MAG: hypothetical protein WBB44_06255 [Candidatus Nanopelagicales bacterium]
MPSGDEVRDAQRATWAWLSASWDKWDSIIMYQVRPVSTAMIERLAVADDQQHLGPVRLQVLPRRGQGDGRVRARPQAGRAAVLVSVGQARREPVDAKVRAYEQDGTVRVPGVARCIVATK